MSCILYELSQNNLGIGPGEFGDEKELANYCQAFQRIYSDGYRQRYSVILDMLTDIDDISSENQDETPDEDEDCLELLSANLALLREYSRTHTKIYGEYTFYGIAKLSDHVDIEIHRYRDKQSMYHDLSETDDNVYALIDRTTDLERMLSESRGELQDAHRAAEKLQMQMVAILGIFAAIVMAFSGGMDILSGAISVSGDSDIFRVAFVVLLCGIVLFNILAFLMYMILAIINTQNKSPRRPGIRISKRSIRISRWLDRFIGSRFIIAFNIILIIAMIVDVICMFLMI